MDDLGNRDSVTLRDDSSVDYTVDANTNRYTQIGAGTPEYDAAGNLIEDYNGYTYEYDYENRVTKIIKPGPTTVAEYVYDAFGRRIKKIDYITSSQSRIYYYNDKWQVLCEYGGRGFVSMLQWFAYGNYIDEPVFRGKQDDETPESTELYFYVHDHLYDTVALVQRNGLSVLERYEYDAYGNCYVLEPDFTADPDGISDYWNPYYFTGRDMDALDGGNLNLMNYRHRYYDTYTGRFFTHDPLGITPNPTMPNEFNIRQQYDVISLYEYVRSCPVSWIDPYGLAQWTLVNAGFSVPPLGRPEPVGYPPDDLTDEEVVDEDYPGIHWPKPVPDPVDFYPPYEPWYSPQLSREGTYECCDNGRKAIEIANIAMRTSGECLGWFYDRRFETRHGVYKVARRSNIFSFCIRGAYAYTAPFVDRIALCERSCCEDPEIIAYYLIHEVGHHYCPIGFGREACAESAVEACDDAVRAAAGSVEEK